MVGGRIFMAGNKERKWIINNVLLYGVFVFYVLLLMMILFREQHSVRSVNMIPFLGIASFLSGNDFVTGGDSSIILRAFALQNLLGNVIIFVPLGVYVSLFNKEKNMLKNTLLIVLVSIVAEATQFILKLGICDIDDVILNGLGGFIGIFICRILYRIFQDDAKVRYIVAILAPIVGIVSFAGLFLYNQR
jgi:glycopeptide antibiotics resistance protein